MPRTRILAWASAAAYISCARESVSPEALSPAGNSGSARRRRRAARRTPLGSAGPGRPRGCGRAGAVPAGPVGPGNRGSSRVSCSDRCVSHVPPDGCGARVRGAGQPAKVRESAGGGIPNPWVPEAPTGPRCGSTTALSPRPAGSGNREKSMGEGFLSGRCRLGADGCTRLPRARRASRWGGARGPGDGSYGCTSRSPDLERLSTGTKIELNRAAQLPPDEGSPKVVRGRTGSRGWAHPSG